MWASFLLSDCSWAPYANLLTLWAPATFKFHISICSHIHTACGDSLSLSSSSPPQTFPTSQVFDFIPLAPFLPHVMQPVSFCFIRSAYLPFNLTDCSFMIPIRGKGATSLPDWSPGMDHCGPKMSGSETLPSFFVSCPRGQHT